MRTFPMLYVEDVPATVAFYEQALGAICDHAHEDGTYAELSLGSLTLGLVDAGLAGSHLPVEFTPNEPSEKPLAFQLYVEVDGLEQAVQRAREAGGTLLGEPTMKPWGRRVAHLRDLNGVVFELSSADRTRYPRPGTRAATTAPQLELQERAMEVLRADERILAAWLVGSFAVGNADAFSDVDVHVCVEDHVAPAFEGEGWKAVLAKITRTVSAVSFPPPAIGGYSLTADWVHIDLVFHTRGALDADALDAFEPLFDKTGELLPASGHARSTVGEPYFPAEVVEWFFYMFGNLVTVVGREEPVLGMLGSITIRDTCLVPLFCAERGVRRTGGAKRLRPFLTVEQHGLLEALPPLAPTLDSVIDSELRLARLFIPRAKALARYVDASWPEALEAATIRHVESGIGVSVFGGDARGLRH